MSAGAVAGCCQPGKFPRDVTGGSAITRDEFVSAWRVNDDRVCEKQIEAAPGCYVVEVEYSAEYLREQSDGDPAFMAVAYAAGGLAGGVGQLAASGARNLQAKPTIHYAKYDSGPVTFVMPVLAGRSYYVTSTFDGDIFWPRIVLTDGSGARVGEVLPTRDPKLLQACRSELAD